MKRPLTLIERLLILMLLVILATVSLTIYRGVNLRSPENVYDEKYLLIQNALKFYKLDNGIYPTQQQGLDALRHKPKNSPIPQHWRPYLKEIPVDSEGHPYLYVEPTSNRHDDTGAF